MSRPIPSEAIDIVAKWEGFRATAYFCPANVPTIGYGHTKTVTAADVGHKTITQDDARRLLADDLKWSQRALERAIGADQVERLTAKQYAALLSFVFNVGAAPEWTIWKKIKAGLDAEVPVQLARFVNAGGRRLEGLVRRRADEADLWRAGLPTPVIVPPPAPVQVETPPPEGPAPAPQERQTPQPPAPRPPDRQAPAPTVRSAFADLIRAILALFRRRR